MNRAATSISIENIRRLAVIKQHLAGKPAGSTMQSILAVVHDLCYVQWDPIDAVAPSHIISFWSRLRNFRPSDLDRLLWDEKKLFLHWTPIASIVLTQDYPIYSSLMRRYPESLSSSWGGNMRRARKFMAEHKDLRKRILSELRKKGPLQANQFHDYVRSKNPDGWTSGSDVSNMLFHLMMSGELMVVGHRGLQNIWGLADEFLPAWVERRELTEEEFEREAALRALRALGAATPREIHLYFPRGRYRNLNKTLKDLEEESKIHRIHVEGLGWKGEQFVHDQDLRLLESIGSRELEPRMTLLAPFDNLLTDRGRTRRLFGFDFIHENFLPPSKRRFGTFVHPILWGDRLIGRVDLRMDRESKELIVIAVHAEPGAPGGREVSSKIAETMEKLGEFLGAQRVVYTTHVPTTWHQALH